MNSTLSVDAQSAVVAPQHSSSNSPEVSLVGLEVLDAGLGRCHEQLAALLSEDHLTTDRVDAVVERTCERFTSLLRRFSAGGVSGNGWGSASWGAAVKALAERGYDLMTAAMLHVVETASSRMKAGVVYRNDAENLHLAINRLQFWQQHNVARSQYRERIAALVSEEVSPVSSADARMTA